MRLYLSGPAGAGKSTVARLLCARYGFYAVSLGGIARLHCLMRGVEPTRAALQAAGDLVRAGDEAGLARLALRTIPEDVDDVVIEGVRLRAEALLLRDAGFVGVAIHARAAVRAARLRARDGSEVVPSHQTEAEATTVPAEFHLLNDGKDRWAWKGDEALARRVAHVLGRIRRRESLAAGGEV